MKRIPTSSSQTFEHPWICFVSKLHLKDPEKNVSSRSAVELHAYANRTRVKGHTGVAHDFKNAGKDLVASQMYFPPHAHCVPALQVWQEADRAAALTGRPTEVISSHMLCRLPQADTGVWLDMIGSFAGEFIVSQGLICEAAIHVPIDKSVHVHFQVSCRAWSADGAFTTSLWDAKSPETRDKWRLGWVNALATHANEN
jgi:hypothetical protein